VAVTKSNSTVAALVAQGPSGPVHILLGNPNTTSVVGTLYLQDNEDSYHITKFTIDAYVPTEIRIDKPLAANQSLYLTLDAAPSAQITIWST
jgi:hypothetical protein